jgi:hypothetical protein
MKFAGQFAGQMDGSAAGLPERGEPKKAAH